MRDTKRCNRENGDCGPTPTQTLCACLYLIYQIRTYDHFLKSSAGDEKKIFRSVNEPDDFEARLTPVLPYKLVVHATSAWNFSETSRKVKT